MNDKRHPGETLLLAAAFLAVVAWAMVGLDMLGALVGA